MSYEYTDPKRASELYALPDVEIFQDSIIEIDMECCGVFEMYPDQIAKSEPETDDVCYCVSCEHPGRYTRSDTNRNGFWYAYGFPGCLWDSDPIGPFATYENALNDARENAGVYDEEEED